MYIYRGINEDVALNLETLLTYVYAVDPRMREQAIPRQVGDEPADCGGTEGSGQGLRPRVGHRGYVTPRTPFPTLPSSSPQSLAASLRQ